MKTNLYSQHLLQNLGIYNFKNAQNTLNNTLYFTTTNYTLQTSTSPVSAAENTAQDTKQKISEEKLIIPQQDGFVVIYKTDIILCKADQNYTELFLRNGKKYIVSKTLKHFENLLGQQSFLRVHKSYLINVNDIVKYAGKTKTGQILLSNGEHVLVSAAKKRLLLAYFK